jgi:hypothetical protein
MRQKTINIIGAVCIAALVLAVTFLSIIVTTPEEHPVERGYMSDIYFDQGGDREVVDNGGVILGRTGSLIDLEDGATLKLQSGATLDLQPGVEITLTELNTDNVTAENITATVGLIAERIETGEIIGGYVEAGEFRTSTTATFDDGADVTGTLRVNTVNPLTGNSIIVSAGATTGTVYVQDNLAVGFGMPSTLNGGDLWTAGDIVAEGSITATGTGRLSAASANISGGISTNVVTATSRVVLKAADSCAGGNLPLQMVGDADTGICSQTANYLNMCAGGWCNVQIGVGGVYMPRTLTVAGQMVWGSTRITLTAATIITPSGSYNTYVLYAASGQNLTLWKPYTGDTSSEPLCLEGAAGTATIALQIAQSGGGSVRNTTGNAMNIGPYDTDCFAGFEGEWVLISSSNNQ